MRTPHNRVTIRELRAMQRELAESVRDARDTATDVSDYVQIAALAAMHAQIVDDLLDREEEQRRGSSFA